MNARIVVAVVGAITLLLGIGGLAYPESVMRFVGYGYQSPPNVAGTLGEVRAVYGGMLIVAAVFTLLAVRDPRAHQGRLLLLGLLWIGTGTGRLFGVFVDGNPGIFGWLALALELGGGGTLIVASQAAGRASISTASTGSQAPPSAP
jgi:protein-S-isoprenylcysteine O-methyltransferase Ste14